MKKHEYNLVKIKTTFILSDWIKNLWWNFFDQNDSFESFFLCLSLHSPSLLKLKLVNVIVFKDLRWWKKITGYHSQIWHWFMPFLLVTTALCSPFWKQTNKQTQIHTSSSSTRFQLFLIKSFNIWPKVEKKKKKKLVS